MIHTKLITYLDKYNLLNEHQLGFQENYSTAMAINKLCDQLIKNVHINLYSCCIFIDLIKALDIVNHEFLFKK